MTHLYTATLTPCLPPAGGVSLATSQNLADHRLPQSQVRAAGDASADEPHFDICRLPFIGRTLNPWLNMSLHDLSLLRLSDARMHGLRMEGDPLCDAAVEALFENGVPVYELMHFDVGKKQKDHMESWGFAIPEDADTTGDDEANKRTLAETVLDLEAKTKDPRLVALITSMLEKPDFGDLGSFEYVIDRAKRLHQRNWVMAGFLLAFRSLFMAYLMPKGMEVLINYGSNLQGPNDFKRLIHTVYWQHLVCEIDDDGLGRDSRAFQATLHVRMMHSAIRRFLFSHGVRKDKSDVGDEPPAAGAPPADLLSSGSEGCPMKQSQRVPWRTAKVGIPINQEDMIGTIFLFSVFLIEGYLQAGIAVSMEDAECNYALWRWIGLRLGILDHNMPKTVFDAIVLGHRIADRSFGVDDRLILYTDSLVEQMTTILPMSRSMAAAVIERFSGEDVRKLVRLPPPSRLGVVLTAVQQAVLVNADVLQRWIPGLFRFLYFIKRPVHKLMFHRAVAIAKASRAAKQQKALRSVTKEAPPVAVPLGRQMCALGAFSLVIFGFKTFVSMQQAKAA